MRLIALTLALLALPVVSAETEYPLWDGEPIEGYAKKVELPPTKTLDLGNGVTMEFVLIPAGTFTMGTPKPEPVNEEYFEIQIWIGQSGLLISVGVVLAILAFVVARKLSRNSHK